ncbi:ribonuclease H [mine drainage metagenome]|uniref:ribonuclease H n=2 Tax=mine drainage metagenome TaxID=410659 RepID=T0ZAK6_9ZZZZ
MHDSARVEIWTDGACSGNPGPGGWAALLRWGTHELELSGSEPVTTNNRMELRAAIEALAALRGSHPVELYTDSRYLRDGVMHWMPDWKRRGWRTSAGKPVRNPDLWQQLDALIHNHTISWHWVRGHEGISYNERVDRLARSAITTVRSDAR